jgi:hypothetical protein
LGVPAIVTSAGVESVGHRSELMHDTKPVPFASSTTCGGRLKLKASLQTVRAVGAESTFATITSSFNRFA